MTVELYQPDAFPAHAGIPPPEGVRRARHSKDKDMKNQWKRLLTALLATLLQWGSAYACTLDSEVYREWRGGSDAGNIFAIVKVLTGKEWNELDEATQRKVIEVVVLGAATPSHAVTSSGVERANEWLEEANLSAGRYRIYSAEEEGDFIKVRLGRKEYWFKERYGCYARDCQKFRV